MFGRFSSGLPGYFLSFVLLAAVAPGCKAQPVASAAETLDVSASSESYVTAKLAVWQKRLKLEDWSITVSLSRASDLSQRP